MPFDFKKEYKEFYQPPQKPSIVDVPAMTFLAVKGAGDPNEEGGAYQQAIGVLYSLAYTIKMSYKGTHAIDGFYQYVVPPLEGFWWQEGIEGIDYTRKDAFNWISVIRVPEFVTPDVFDWTKAEAERKKKIDCSTAELLAIREGLCVQVLHRGSFDSEPESVELMDAYARDQDYVADFSSERLHHEIYLSDPRKTAPDKCKTVIRHPVRKGELPSQF